MSSFNPFGKKDADKDAPKAEVKKDVKEESKKEAGKEEVNDQNPDNKLATKEEAKGNGVCQMKRGDYMIHIMIEQAKDLLMNPEDTVDPIVEVKCMGQRKFTSAQDHINNTSAAIWNEHIFFEPKNQEVEDLERGKIELKLMDKGFFKDALIGFYEFDLSFLYQQPDHSLQHKWIVMTNPESENFGEVSGMLKISITISGEGDEQVQIEEDEHPEIEDIIQPPQVKPIFYQLKFRIFRAQEIVPLDKKLVGANSTDLYLKLEYKTAKLKTTTMLIKEHGECTFNEEFLVPAQIPIVGGRLVIKIYDKDVLLDELIGSCYFNIKDLVPDADGNEGQFNGMLNWKNVYGAPPECSGTNSDKMNNNPEIASFWKGRILFQCCAEKTEKPLLLIRPIQEEKDKKKMEEPGFVDENKIILQNAENATKLRQFSVQCFVSSLLAMPVDNKSYTISLRIGEKQWSTGDPVVVKPKFCRYNKGITNGNNIISLPYLSIADIGSIFIYLHHKYKVQGEKRICFKKLNATNFANPNPSVQWFELEPDLSVGKVKEHYLAGVVGIKLAIHDVTANGEIDWLNYKTWNETIKKRPTTFKIRVFLWQARDLPAADENGSADPFVQIVDSDKSQVSKTIFENLNPLYYEAIDALIEATDINSLPPLIVDVYDKDEKVTGDTQDFIARAILKVQDLQFSTSQTIPKPAWYPLYFKAGGPMSGEILLSFAIVADDYKLKETKKLRLEKEVKMEEFQVSMNILGLRGLQSPGLLPVKKAFLNFNLRSMVPPALGTNLNNIRTEPKMPGSDPTLNTLIEFMAPLPIEKLYCPRLSVQVFDNIAMGLSQPLIGTFIIPVGDLMHDLAEERIREIAALETVVNQIRKFVSGEMLMMSFRKLIKTKQDEENKRLEEELEQVRIKQKLKDELHRRLIAHQNQTVDEPLGVVYSLNQSARGNMYGIQESLLDDDADEEIRMSETISKKQESLEGPEKRLDQEQIQQITEQVNLDRASRKGSVSAFDDQDQIRTGSQGSRSNSVSSKKSKGTPRSGSLASGGSQDGVEKKFDPKRKIVLIANQNELIAFKRRAAEEERKKAEQELNSGQNVIEPKYEFDDHMKVDREKFIPSSHIFIGLGWDEDKDTKRRHYRRYYPDELENCKEIMPISSPFNQYNLKRGQSRGADVSFWSKLTNQVKHDASGADSTDKVVGRFKAVIEVESRQKKQEYLLKKQDLIQKLIYNLKQLAKNRGIEDFDLDLEKLETMEGRQEMKYSFEPLGVNYLDVVNKLADIESDVILKRMLLKQKKMVVRIYMISGFDLASRDLGSESDPYLILKLGQKKISDRKNYVLDCKDPPFYKHWDFEAVFPGCPMLFIEAMDFDELFGDDLIGNTQVDLEDRFFLPEWIALKEKPVEYRQLYHPSSSQSQGQLKMWIEINPASCEPEKEQRIYDISQKPPEQYQMRVCIFDTKEIKMMDDEGTSDVFIRAFFDSKKGAIETDTHYRCQTGNASFNYRLNFKVQHPRTHYNFTVQAFDRDFFKSNDIIGSSVVDLRKAFDDASLTKRPLRITEEYFNGYMRKEGDKDLEWDKDGDSFWLPMMAKNKEGKLENNGKVHIRIDITSMEIAEKQKIGSAREDPNIEPYLPPPVGRLHFSFNPCEMYKQLIGPAMRRKIAIWCCIVVGSLLCVLILYYLVPVVVGDLIAGWIGHGF